jgi:molybdopterin/thiamine biosynthesis adenylyltransferase/rhodanese-related sulfurtransferase
LIFSEHEWLRYSRHIQLPQVGAEGQTKLKSARVLLIGLGGLGSPVSLYLAAAGVGSLTLIDGDIVDASNLQRQILFGESDVGTLKTDAAKRRLSDLNADIRINIYPQVFTLELANQLKPDFDIVIDCTDNFAARYLINDYCLTHQLSWLYAGIHQFSGQCALFTPKQACFRCFIPSAPEQIEDCNSAGVLGVLPGLLGILQANEALKFLVGLATPLANTLLIFDAQTLEQQKMKLTINPECLCQTDSDQALKQHHDTPFSCSSEVIHPAEINSDTFNKNRELGRFVTLDVREDNERCAFHIGGTHTPLAEIPLADLGQENTYLCYCQSGIRSLKAAELLQDKGLKAYSLKGGLASWLKSSLHNK